MIYVYGKAESYQETDWLGWTDSLATARENAGADVDRYHIGIIMHLRPDGTIHEEVLRHEPEPYTGPLATARVNYMNKPGYFHRAWVDCARPSPTMKLTSDNPWRVVATSVMPEADSPDPNNSPNRTPGHFVCVCGEWQDIEGEPTSVAEMAAKHPVRSTT